jgi:hypothetical protein
MNMFLRSFLTLMVVLLVAFAFATVYFAAGVTWGTDNAGALVAFGWIVTGLAGFGAWGGLR